MNLGMIHPTFDQIYDYVALLLIKQKIKIFVNLEYFDGGLMVPRIAYLAKNNYMALIILTFVYQVGILFPQPSPPATIPIRVERGPYPVSS